MSILYSPHDVARVLRIDVKMVLQAIHTRELTALSIEDEFRISASDLIPWIGIDYFLEVFQPLEDSPAHSGSNGPNADYFGFAPADDIFGPTEDVGHIFRSGGLSNEDSETLAIDLLSILVRLGFKRDDSNEHLHHVASLSEAIAYQLGWTAPEAARLKLASTLHDIGKVLVSETLLSKPSPLSDLERNVFHEHTQFGAYLLSGTQSPLLWMAREIAQCHHERWDGGGYPDGLQGKAIPLSARIVMVADVYDALVSDRPYKRGWSPHQALQDVCSQSGTQFDPTVVDAFCTVWMQKFNP